MRKLLALILVCLGLSISTVSACGGLFCQTSPVNQQAERIIFAMNDDGTISAYVQINFTGNSSDFAWVVPVPSVPGIDVAEMASFNELDLLTQPVFIPPARPNCFPAQPQAVMMSGLSENAVSVRATDTGVIVLASGTAGPYAYDVITSEDSNAMFRWLRENDYQVTPEMGPLLRVYTEEDMIFLAMKLQPENGVQDIQPIVMTYESDVPMIPIRLTAVAANPNMNILTWIFADEQAYPANYETIKIANDELRSDFTSFGGINYTTLLDSRIDQYQGLGMITEYAQPSSELAGRFTDPLLVQLSQEHGYLTRLLGRMSPEEMTVDPVFMFNEQLENVSNIRDLSQVNAEVFWNCPPANYSNLVYVGVFAGLFSLVLGGGIMVWLRRSKTKRA
jgi:hypothetical protein